MLTDSCPFLLLRQGKHKQARPSRNCYILLAINS
ncbi:MAG: hypothetical protein ACI934_000642, partial [Pseudohongiellaceae bacterium]